jgi:signal transduction histidine kinase/CheY-like chemotaxis protein
VALKTVRVPATFAPLFEQAETIVSRYFADKREDPERGTIEIFGERYVLVRAASLSVEFFQLVADLFGPGRERDAADFARNILFDLAHGVGKSDARNFHAKMGLVDPIARLSAGPVHFAHAGWAFVDISPESRPSADLDYFLLYDHPYSFESDAWLRAGRKADFAVCIMNAGYSSGWCEESFGIELVASEVLCRAKGDDCCRFVMAPPQRIEERMRGYIRSKPHLAEHMHAWQIPDLFARKRLEEELRRHRDELEVHVAERTAELRHANEQLQREMSERREVESRLRQAQKLEAIGRLAGGIAHDFNNLLTAVAGYTELGLASVDPGDELHMYLDEIRRASDRATTLTRQLLAFSRQQVLTVGVIDLGATIGALANMLRRLIGERIRLTTLLAPDLGHVKVDATQLEQAILNLAVNARDAMPSGGDLTIKCANVAARSDAEPELGWVSIEVRDNGVGMDDETRAHVFEPFFTTKEQGQGTGLGLATVYGIVQQSGGSIEVESALGRGTTFRILLPRSAEPLAPAEPAHARATPSRQPAKVLLVEDEAGVRGLVRRELESLGYSVIEAGDPESAMVLAASASTIDLLVTDVVMPHMNGPELATRLRASRPKLKVLFMSGYAPEMIGEVNALGPDQAFLPKPYRLSELARKVSELLAAR